MKDIYSDARREKIGNLNRGKKFSPETIERMREKALTRSPMSEETKKNVLLIQDLLYYITWIELFTVSTLLF